MLNKPAIEFVKASKKFNGTKDYAVSEVSVSIEEGSFITVLGTSGSGKTTLLKMINRIYEASSGKILFFGESVEKLPVEKLRLRIGYVIQQIGLFPHMTVEQNIGTVPKILHWNKQKISERVDNLLNLVNLPPDTFRKRYPRQLSGGQQQRVGLARAMAANPEIMLMDEPFGAIDAITRQNLQDELLRIQRKLNKTIIFVTHDVNEAFKLGDKVIVMNRGKIEQFDTPYNILFNPANKFVSRLVTSDDTLQRLKFLRANQAIIPIEIPINDEMIRVGGEESLYNVLTTHIFNDGKIIIVEDDKNNVIGQIDWKQLQLKFGEENKEKTGENRDKISV
ncbi:osmoprotectant transport system ATP-binding protein [Clostridium acidisoli DSM 12555]|uniref:ABC-type quaternary amine transporter n=1 Tax=Clostridium acidisoli DSM 12555 TaxID=1121291 RepID=A0A1W1XS87_9CLOT|nr:ABC transporter ATP-binding protein [Clostridium acidisoli]SMC26757.1 osmoprotectant transport system ATP-binding protein [Clostridium acidisoli DSM 12555]